MDLFIVDGKKPIYTQFIYVKNQYASGGTKPKVHH
jgi:hypothetical protein